MHVHASGSTSISSLWILLVTFAFSMTFTPSRGQMSAMMLADDSGTVKCGACDADRCPELNYCEGQAIKDSCNCCTVCSSPKYQPHVSIVTEDKCAKITCPKFQVCVANLQGLPLCKCPGNFLCRNTRKREVCGSDGHTYESRCHMRIASCNQGIMVRKKHRGVCTPEDVKEGEIYKRKMKRRMRRLERKRQRQIAEQTSQLTTVEIGRKNGRPSGYGGELSTGFDVDADEFDASLINRAENGVDDDGDNGGVFSVAKESKKKRDRSKRKKDREAMKKKKRRRRRKRKQRKMRKGGKKDKKERRRRRRKRQHRPKSRSKRHKLLRPIYYDVQDDVKARQRAFEAVYGDSTWWAK